MLVGRVSAAPIARPLCGSGVCTTPRARGPLQAVIERAGYAGLMDDAAEQKEGKQLATLPENLARFDLENFRDRPVQAARR